MIVLYFNTSLYSEDFSALRSQKERYQFDVDRDLGGLAIKVTGWDTLADHLEAPHRATALCLAVGCPLTPWTSCDTFWLLLRRSDCRMAAKPPGWALKTEPDRFHTPDGKKW